MKEGKCQHVSNISLPMPKLGTPTPPVGTKISVILTYTPSMDHDQVFPEGLGNLSYYSVSAV